MIRGSQGSGYSHRGVVGYNWQGHMEGAGHKGGF